MDDMKLKMKLHQENAQSDADILLDAEDRMKNLTETNNRYKTQLESTRQRIAAVTREKYENEEKVVKLSEELDKKVKIVSDLQHKCAELERTVVAVEATAQQQLHQLANQSEEAIDTAQSRLIQANHRLKEFNKFLKVSASSISFKF
jgi:centlein